ncbi:phage terminase large subunit [Peribacillus muralis]|uniref:phage terminase large subunit n=1 Tax=Peribacillus muralis TaxID=264697 RepID=UPI003670A461
MEEWKFKENKLNTYKAKVKELRDAGTLPADKLQQIINNIKVLEKDYAYTRGRKDILFFTYYFFSDHMNPENDGNLIPEGVRLEDAPGIHAELAALLQDVSAGKFHRICWSMPRGHGKSMMLSNILPIYSFVYRTERFILIISEAEAQSQKFGEWVNDQLKHNARLRDVFGDDIAPNKSKGHKDNVEMFDNGYTLLQCGGMGKRLRGIRYKSYRPTMVIGDDCESSQNTNTLELKQKNIDFWNKVIQPIGTPDTKFIYMGTLVANNSLLTHIMERADYRSKLYSAITSYPDRSDLWDSFEEVYRNQENPSRMEDAINFYETNKIEMDKGAATLWPERFPYHKLMMEKVNIGSRAFSSEFLNIGYDDENAIFKESDIQYFDDKDLFDQFGRPVRLDVYQFWDIAVGKNQRSDYNAIVTIGRDNRTGVIYVLDAWAKKCPMHEALEIMFDKIVEYRPKIAGVETIQAQHEMFRQLQQIVNKRGVYHTKIKAVMPRGNKESRIESLEPIVENGAMRFKKNQRLLLEMLTQFGDHDHDDLPDALASVVSMSGGSKRQRGFYRKPAGL